MRNFFRLELRGKTLFLPYAAAWVLVAGATVAYLCFMARHAVPDPLLDGEFAARVAAGLLLAVLSGAACCFMLYFFVRATAGGLSLSGERFEVDYPARTYAALCTKGILLSAVTLGVWLPWFVRDLVRYFAAGTSFRFNAFEFRGSAPVLFSYAVLLCVAPAFVLLSSLPLVLLRARMGAEGMYVLGGVLYLVLLAFLCFYRAVSLKWYADFAYGRKRMTCGVRVWRAGWYVFGQAVLTVVTLGLYAPMALLRVWKYYVDRLVLGEVDIEDRFGFSLRPGRDYLFVLGQMLLTCVTFGIYYPWAYARVMSLLVGRSWVEEQEERGRQPMPESGL